MTHPESTSLRVTFPTIAPHVALEALRDATDTLIRVAKPAPPNVIAIDAHRRLVLETHLRVSPANVPLRVWFSVLCDLAMQGWQLSMQGDIVAMRAPEALTHDPRAEKERVRNGHLIERDRLLSEHSTRRFVREMETARLHDGKWHSIFSLLRDGQELSSRLREISATHDISTLTNVISPYLQFIKGTEKCRFTGLRLLDVWRYLRLTWSTIPQSIPGRRMLVLVRDAAAENHPVIGIAALGSPVVQLRIRDEWIGWQPDVFLQDLSKKPTAKWASWVLNGVRDSISDIDTPDLIREGIVSSREVQRPTLDAIVRLREYARAQRSAHERNARSGGHKAASSRPTTTDWRKQSMTYLFRSKRALALASSLEVRLTLQKFGMKASAASLKQLISTRSGQKAVSAVLRYNKAKHVGIDLLDITVCGAIAPYTHLLGGKLVALLLTSPEIINAYRRRYSSAPSIIASAMKGKAVTRKPNLVALGTTSLYGVASSQYNRLVIPREAIPDMLHQEVRYLALGRSEGYGVYHFSQRTVDEMLVLAQQRRSGRKVNFIFGEGTNPKMRLVREALDAVDFPADQLLQHRSPRLVYAVALASNYSNILIGVATRPRYHFTGESKRVTSAIATFWIRRWLSRRIQSAEVLSKVASHSTLSPVTHGARVQSITDEAGLPLFT